MKYIFDFDDILFCTTAMFKKRMYMCLEEVGISHKTAQEYYKKVRENKFSLKNFISELFTREKNNKNNIRKVYEKIMSECENFTNAELLKNIKKLGKENCFIVTNGEKGFQKDKIKRSGISPLFSKIYVVSGSKKDIIYSICDKYKNEKVIFIDDKVKFFEDINLKKCPNLKTVLYTGQNITNLLNYQKSKS
jgi:FMN phosphatase YigB (HAD superfamily)